jgi:hypothetical protein
MNNKKYFGGSKLGWSEYNFKEYAKIPPSKINGGLYTGEKFNDNAEYGNIDILPSEDYMTNKNLASANPPKSALYQYNNHRPGNNPVIGYGLSQYENYNFTCYSDKK